MQSTWDLVASEDNDDDYCPAVSSGSLSRLPSHRTRTSRSTLLLCLFRLLSNFEQVIASHEQLNQPIVFFFQIFPSFLTHTIAGDSN